MEVKFSIIVPVYKAESSIRKCLDSLLNSSLSEIEIICVNDASPDNSLHILKGYQKKDSRIKVVDLKENQGVAVARNTGLDMAQGTYICFVDSDDWVDERHIEDIYRHMQKEKSDINLISFKFVKPDKVIWFPDISQFVARFGSATQKMDSVEKLTMLDDYCWRLVIRRSFWEKHKIYFPAGIKGSEDQCFWKPLELRAERVSFYENYGYNYLWNAASLTKAEMSSFETVRGIDELMRRLPQEYHLPLMEKCCKRIHDFGMKNIILKNKLKREYVGRMYAKARECGARGYAPPEYNYITGPFFIKKTKEQKTVSLLGIPLYKVTYTENRKRVYLFNVPVFSTKR